MNFRVPIFAAALLALTACSANPDDGQDRIWSDEVLVEDGAGEGAPADARGGGSVTTDALRAPAAIAGEYRLAGVDGSATDLPHAITVSIDDQRIRYVSHCVTGAWDYGFDGDRVATRAVVETVCDRGRYPEEIALDEAFGAGGTFRRTPANAVEFTGGGHTVTLFSQ